MRWKGLPGIGLAFLAGAVAGVVATVSVMGRNDVAGAGIEPRAEAAAGRQSSPSSAGLDQGEAYRAFIRLGSAPVSREAVEGAFSHYIAISEDAARVRTDVLAPRIAALGPPAAGAIDRLYVQPLLVAGLRLDDCAAAVLAARLDAPDDPQQAAESGRLKQEECGANGLLADITTSQLPRLMARCRSRLDQVLVAAQAGRLRASELAQTAIDPATLEADPCPDPSGLIGAGQP
jgi:hypothetical protein